jgi:hypothetical protein
MDIDCIQVEYEIFLNNRRNAMKSILSIDRNLCQPLTNERRSYMQATLANRLKLISVTQVIKLLVSTGIPKMVPWKEVADIEDEKYCIEVIKDWINYKYLSLYNSSERKIPKEVTDFLSSLNKDNIYLKMEEFVPLLKEFINLKKV